MSNKERFLELCSQIKRDNLFELLDWLETSDFYIAPASTVHHGACEGGLLQHSLNVYDELVKLAALYYKPGELPLESLLITALFHDLCKVNMYVQEKRYKKNDAGQWEQYDAYTKKEKLCYGGHGSKSVFILQNFIKLTAEEAVAINCHMGSWDGNNSVGDAYSKSTLAWLLHVADESATFVVEGA